MKFDKIQVPKVAKLKTPNIGGLKTKLTVRGVMAAPKHLSVEKALGTAHGKKVPTLRDFKATVPKGGLTNKSLRQSYGRVPGLNT